MMMFSSGTNVAFGRGIDDDLAAGKALADVVVGVAFEVKVMPRGMKAPKLWPAEPLKWMRIVSSGSPPRPSGG
jgi:hypothetical protein